MSLDDSPESALTVAWSLTQTSDSALISTNNGFLKLYYNLMKVVLARGDPALFNTLLFKINIVSQITNAFDHFMKNNVVKKNQQSETFLHVLR